MYSRVSTTWEQDGRVDVPSCSRHTLDVPTRNRADVAAIVQRRMDSLRITPAQLVIKAGVDKNTVRDFLAGERRLQAENRLKFDDALQWEPGSLRDVYNGGEPREVPKQSEPEKPDFETLSDDDLLAELCRRLKQRHQPQHPVPLSITRSPYAPPEDPGVGGDEEPDHRRQFGST